MKLSLWIKASALLILFPLMCFFGIFGLGGVPDSWSILEILIYYPSMWGLTILCGWAIGKIIKSINKEL